MTSSNVLLTQADEKVSISNAKFQHKMHGSFKGQLPVDMGCMG
jgi:hypothetical protein